MDDPRIGYLLDQTLDHQDADGRFQSYASERSSEPPVWGALLCDSHAVLDVLIRAGRADHPRRSVPACTGSPPHRRAPRP